MVAHLGVVELHGVVSGQGDHQALLEELQQWVLVVLQEQAVVAERRHGNGDLRQEVQVLQHGALGAGTKEDGRKWRVNINKHKHTHTGVCLCLGL